LAASDARAASEQRFKSIRSELENHLRRRYRLLRNEHEDLLQQTLSDLFEATRDRLATFPDEELTALAYAILKRRIVDRFRRETRSVIQDMPSDAVPEPHDDGTFVDRMHYRRLLRAVLSLVDELTPEQKALVLDESASNADGSRTPAQRQQLRRLRAHLRSRLATEYGIRIDDQSLGD
jgi:DNA-directed RNA polymerase specialized sigma24 family protein